MKSAGDGIRGSKLAKQLELPETDVAPTRQQQHILEIAELIHTHNWSQDSSDLAFMAKHLVQVTLPHSDPGDVPIWSRTNGGLTLVIARTQLNPKTNTIIGYPYGTIPRLLLYWLTREAVRTKSRRLELGASLSEFMREVGLNPKNGTGPKSDAFRLKEQMTRLFASNISFQFGKKISTGTGTGWLNMPVSRKGQLWWDPKDPNSIHLWKSWIELGEDFFQAITSSPVPMDTRILKALNKSPLALDVYAWATYRAFSVTKHGKSEFISYQDFMAQLGTDYANPKNFKQKLLLTLKKVQIVYPQLRLESLPKGLVVHPCQTSIPSSNKVAGV